LEKFDAFINSFNLSIYIFSFMLLCWMLVTTSEGSYYREQKNPDSENIQQHILELINFTAFIGGILWGFINLQWDFVILVLLIIFLISFGFLSTINIITGHKDPHLFFIRFREYFYAIVFLCCVTLWVVF
jgi:hypothetical protein